MSRDVRPGVVAWILQKVPIVAMTARKPLALRGRHAVPGRNSARWRKPPAPSEADGIRLDSGPGRRELNNEPRRLRVWPARLDRIRRSTPASLASGFPGKGRFVFRLPSWSASSPALQQRLPAHGRTAVADPPRRRRQARLA